MASFEQLYTESENYFREAKTALAESQAQLDQGVSLVGEMRAAHQGELAQAGQTSQVPLSMDSVIQSSGLADLNALRVIDGPVSSVRDGDVIADAVIQCGPDKPCITVKHRNVRLRNIATEGGREGITVFDGAWDCQVEHWQARRHAMAIKAPVAPAHVKFADIGWCKDGFRLQMQSSISDFFIHSFRDWSSPTEHHDGGQPLMTNGLTIERGVILAFFEDGTLRHTGTANSGGPGGGMNSCLFFRSERARTLVGITLRDLWLAGGGYSLRVGAVEASGPPSDTTGLTIERVKFLGGHKWPASPYLIDVDPDVWRDVRSWNGQPMPFVKRAA